MPAWWWFQVYGLILTFRMDFATSSYSFYQVNMDVKASRSDVSVGSTVNVVSKHCIISCMLSRLLYFGNTKSVFDNFCQNTASDAAWFCKSSCDKWAIKFKKQSSGVSHYNFQQVLYEYFCIFWRSV